MSKLGTSEAAASDPGLAGARTGRWAIYAGVLTLAVTVVLLAVWLGGGLAGAAVMSPVMKTNTVACLLLLSLSLVIQALVPAWRAAATVPVALAMLLGAATLLEYGLGIDLRVDQLLAPDIAAGESARFPNRMSPNAAAGILMMGMSLRWLRSPRPVPARLGQVLTLGVMGLGLFSLVGYLYGAVLLYKPTPFIRISPYTAGAFVLLGSGVLALRLDLGLVRLLVLRNVAGMLLRPLLAVTVVVPILFGWLMVHGEDSNTFDPNLGTAFLAGSTIITFVVVIAVLARWIDTLEARRSAVEDNLRRVAVITSELARAATADEVAEVTVRVGLPALGAVAGGVVVPNAEGTELRIVRATGYSQQALDAHRAFGMESDIPAAVAFRRNEALFISTRDEYLRLYPSVSPEVVASAPSRAAVPLRGRDRTLGVLTMTFAEPQTFDEATRARILSLGSQCGLALDRALLFESERAANKAKDDFLAMLGHELRNPLAPIVTSLELMNLRDEGSRQERTVIARQVRHMTRLVDDLLDVSRITRGKVELRKQRMELGECVARAVENAGALFEQRQQNLAVDVPEHGLPVMVDPQRIEQVISNLLTNASKYSNPGGNVEISARAAGDLAVLDVRDDGIGIAPELLPNVFDLFTQGHHTIERAQGGLGLGLALVRSLTQMHGGTAVVESDGAGRGCTFSITLPLDRRAPDASSTAAAVAAAASEGPYAAIEQQAEAARAARGCRVLVVDDNQDAAELLAELLRMHGHEVRIAGDGAVALATAEEFRPELAFLDLGLPVINGFDVARRLRAAQDGRPLTLVAVTGYGQDADRARTAAAGFDKHLVKPIEIDETLAIADQISAAVAGAPAATSS